MDVGVVLGQFLDRPRVAYVRAVLDVYGRAPGGLLANGLAFAALFAAFPIAFVTLGVAGLLLDNPADQAALADSIAAVAPPLRAIVDEAVTALASGAGFTSIIGVIGLIWTVSQFYVTLDVAFSRIFSDRPERDVFRRMARGFAWVAGLVGIVVVLVVAGTLAAIAEAFLPESYGTLWKARDVLSSPPVLIGVGVLVVGIVYRVVPPIAPPLRAIWLPAVVAGTAIVALSQLFLFLAPRLIGAAALAGSLATAFVALAWLSFTFQALLYGASWVRVRDDRSAETDGSALAGAATAAEAGGRGE
jgi:YihY family inner membrane protein